MSHCRKCAHPRDAHEHLRRGTDCSICWCRRFRRWLPLRRA